MSMFEASIAPMTGTRDAHTGDEWFIRMLSAINDVLQLTANVGRHRDNKWSLKNEL